MRNPFDRFDLNPQDNLQALTEALRDLAESSDENERPKIQAIWRILSSDPFQRALWALTARPKDYESNDKKLALSIQRAFLKLWKEKHPFHPPEIQADLLPYWIIPPQKPDFVKNISFQDLWPNDANDD